MPQMRAWVCEVEGGHTKSCTGSNGCIWQCSQQQSLLHAMNESMEVREGRRTKNPVHKERWLHMAAHAEGVLRKFRPLTALIKRPGSCLHQHDSCRWTCSENLPARLPTGINMHAHPYIGIQSRRQLMTPCAAKCSCIQRGSYLSLFGVVQAPRPVDDDVGRVVVELDRPPQRRAHIRLQRTSETCCHAPTTAGHHFGLTCSPHTTAVWVHARPACSRNAPGWVQMPCLQKPSRLCPQTSAVHQRDVESCPHAGQQRDPSRTA